MLPLVPSRWFFESHAGPLSETNLMRAHIAAPDLLAMIDTELKSYRRQQALHLVIAGTAPLVGYLWLNWSAGLIALALLLNVIASGLGDRLKLRLAGQQMAEEMRRTWEIEHLDGVARSMTRPVKTYHADQDSTTTHRHQHRRPRWVYRGVDVRQEPLSACHYMLAEMQQIMAIPVFAILLPMLYILWEQLDLLTVLLMTLAMLAEMTRAGFVAWQARNNDQPGPELFPDSVLAGAVFTATAMLLLGWWWLLDLLEELLPHGSLAGWEAMPFELGILFCYLIACLAIVIGWQALNGRRIETMHRFADQDREQLRQRWLRLNGDLEGLRLTRSR